MGLSDQRALWLSRYVLPHEHVLRSWLKKRQVRGLEVDDIVQETYARLIELESVDNISDVRKYLFQAAFSILASHVRRSKIVSFQTVSDLEDLSILADEVSPEDQTIGRDELRHVGIALAELPGKIRDVFVLRRVNGLSQRDVARKLGLSESTVEKHMSRGFLLLVQRLSDGGKGPARASKAWGVKKMKDSVRSNAKKNRSGD
ncbi:RNA polymerase sigma factor [Asticcacaulis sp. W401b]|uniref:RNA polymerase sigma factor n=1 Tax=Asticcacaulis sp. W401b TaxID=3388666 RepID=UPI003970E37E